MVADDVLRRALLAVAMAAHALATDRNGSLPSIRHAHASVWRCCPALERFSALVSERQLHEPVETWLDDTVRGDLVGLLIEDGAPSALCLEIIRSAGVKPMQSAARNG